ncbi:MAG: EI24 domain-containing protein [Limimaricola soesokkakensis]|uniref:EI24 domain-containing protein n=1 Tax=Limimaricola soesokkakensis TaxID=1343159 RepID=UPI0040581719
MILTDFMRALAQMFDPRFRRVLWLGIGLSAGLLVALYAGLLALVGLFAPDSVTLPLIGAVAWIDDALGWGSLLLMLGLSVFLMLPVASMMSGFFLEEVAGAVEARHYPGLPPARTIPLADQIRDTFAFLAVLVLVNVAAFAVSLAFPPAAPFLFYGGNGWLLGREYFQVAAMRREGRAGAHAMRRRHPLRIWGAGCLMAVPLTVPVVNLLVPVLGAATFTHLYHRLARRRPATR